MGSIRTELSVRIAQNSNVTISLAGFRRLDKFTRLGLGVDCSSSDGVSLELK